MNVLFVNGSKRDSLHAVSYYNPTFLYGINCFEGVRAYWNESKGQLIFLDLPEHLRRLYRSADFMSLKPPLPIDDLHTTLLRIAVTENIREDTYVRVTFFLGGDGSWHSVNDIHYMISFRSMPSELDTRAPATVGITRFRRLSSGAMPAHVKAGANYLNSRYAMLDVRARGFDDALFLTADGYVSEATGSSIFLITRGELHTPSLECDILPGITRARLIQLCTADGIVVRELAIHHDDLSSYHGALLTGTMVEMRLVSRLEARAMTIEDKLLARLKMLFRTFTHSAGPENSHVTF